MGGGATAQRGVNPLSFLLHKFDPNFVLWMNVGCECGCAC
jgi:hypothetical protein